MGGGPRVFLFHEVAADRVISVRQLLELEHVCSPSLRKSVSSSVTPAAATTIDQRLARVSASAID